MMNSKIKNYVDVLFCDVPRSKKAMELKEEILSNMDERYEDYIKEGKSENQAYSLTVASMGEVDDLMSEVLPDADFKKEAQRYRTRNARNLAIAIAMYIIGAALVVGFGYWSTQMGTESVAVLGVVILLVLAAIATAVIIYTFMSTPREFKDYDEQKERESKFLNTKEGKLFQAIMSIFWSAVTFIYLAVSFLTMAWHITWIIWPLAGVASAIVKTVLEMKNGEKL